MQSLLLYIWKIFLKITNPSCEIKATGLGRNISLDKHVTLEKGSFILAKKIGRYTYINKFCLIEKNVESIGNYCSIAYNVKIGLGSHPFDWVSSHPFAYAKKYGFVKENNFEIASTAPKCFIGNDVWIGANAIILAGVTVGDGAIIGANTLVNKNVEPYSIVVGTPAKHLRYRFETEIINKLMDIKWWNWTDDQIKSNIHLMNNPESLIKNYSI